MSNQVKPKILVFDLETTPHEGLYWGRAFETDIIEGVEYGKILCYAAKWLGQKTYSRGWVHFQRNKELSLVRELRELLDKADLVVGQNIKAFDIKWCNAKFAYYGLAPPSPYKVFDTKTEAKKYFNLPSYGLDNMADYFGLGRKLSHEGFSMWRKCLSGQRRAWSRLMKYCRNDVDLTEKLFKLLQPFVETKMIYFNGICTHCGNAKLQRRGLTLNKKYQRVQCRNCAGWGQLRI